MPYDLFISYSRRDNEQGQVTALKEQIEADYHIFANEALRCFFDTTAIEGAEDWRHRILAALRESNLLLLVLSPFYLSSSYCEWEIVEFLKYEHSRSVGGQGVMPVYFVEIPGLDDPEFEQQSAAWVARVRRRNHIDLRPWYDEGTEALKRADVHRRLDDLGQSLQARLSKLRRLREAPGNLPAHNPRFVGRETEMQRLHEAAGLGRFGVLTAVHGMGGVGKTALAIQYAYAYADFYPGGRWLIGCAGETSLPAVLRKLDLDLGITFDESEKKDDLRAAKRILAELERRAVDGARVRAGEKAPPQPKTLLLLDNVDDPALLQPPQSDLVAGKSWLHLLATTRLGTEDLGNNPDRQTLLSIDELPLEDALRLIESYQPSGRFATPLERTAAADLVKLLDNFTLAIEVVAVYLGEHAGRITCDAFLERLKKEGLAGLDKAALGTRGGIAHGEKLISATLTPTLNLLTPEEQRVIAFAAFLPPDIIPLPWLRTLAAEEYPELGRDAEPGYDDPWLSLVNHLLGLRLLQLVEIDPDAHTARLVRMHRLVGELARTMPHFDPEKLQQELSEMVIDRCHVLQETWYNNHWEIPPVVAFTRQQLLYRDTNAPRIMRALCQWFIGYDYGRESEQLLRLCLAQEEADPETDQANLSVTLNNLGHALILQQRLANAEVHLSRALRITEEITPEDEYTLSVRHANLGMCFLSQGKYAEAESFLRKALDLAERSSEPDDRQQMICINNLGVLLHDIKHDFIGAAELHRRNLNNLEPALGPEDPLTLLAVQNLAVALLDNGDLSAAEPLHRRALEGQERVLGHEHPETLKSVYCMAIFFDRKGNHAKAEEFYRKALDGWSRVLGPEHPNTLDSLHRLAKLLKKIGRIEEAESLFRRLLEAQERILGPDHPDTLQCVDSFSDLLENMGKNEEARALRRQYTEV